MRGGTKGEGDGDREGDGGKESRRECPCGRSGSGDIVVEEGE